MVDLKTVNREFPALLKRKKRGEISNDEYVMQRDIILDSPCIRNRNRVPDTKAYEIVLVSCHEKNQNEVGNILYQHLGWDFPSTVWAVLDPPITIAKGVSKEKCDYIQSRIDSLFYPGTEISIGPDPEWLFEEEVDDGLVRCPKCGSTAVATGARGVNFWSGLIGASDTVNRCGKCGYMWKPMG